MKSSLQDTTLLGHFANEAGCEPTCHWRAHYSIIHQGFQIRHNDGEAVLIRDSARLGLGDPLPEDIQRWLKTLHRT